MPNFIDRIKLITDGACRGNPGPGAIGLIIYDENQNELERFSDCIGETTNNRAEYLALIKGLDYAAGHTRGTVNCFLDSRLVINQMTGIWRLKKVELRNLFQEAKNKERAFNTVRYNHLRNTNPLIRSVDMLAKRALEGR